MSAKRKPKYGDLVKIKRPHFEMRPITGKDHVQAWDDIMEARYAIGLISSYSRSFGPETSLEAGMAHENGIAAAYALAALRNIYPSCVSQDDTQLLFEAWWHQEHGEPSPWAKTSITARFTEFEALGFIETLGVRYPSLVIDNKGGTLVECWGLIPDGAEWVEANVVALSPKFLGPLVEAARWRQRELLVMHNSKAMIGAVLQQGSSAQAVDFATALLGKRDPRAFSSGARQAALKSQVILEKFGTQYVRWPGVRLEDIVKPPEVSDFSVDLKALEEGDEGGADGGRE